MRRLLVILTLLLMMPTVSTTAEEPFVRVSPRDARYFELTDGRPWIPIGCNMVTVGGLHGERAVALMDRWMQKLEENHGNFIRIWLSTESWDIEHEKAGEFDLERAKTIDGLLAAARKHHIRVKLTLEHFRTIDPDIDRRRAWSNKALQNVTEGGPAKSIADYFDGVASRAQFERKLDFYARRYGSDPTIFGWELWNEINAVAGGDYMAWTRAMLPELHKRFPKNLCMQSLGSFDTDGVRATYRRLATMPGNDVAQVHRYLDLGARLAVCHGPVDVLAADAVRELLAAKPGKPVMLAESGAVEPHHAGPFKLYAKDKEGIILHDILFAPFFAGAAGAGQCWHWDQYIDRNNLWWQFGRFAAAVQEIDPPAEHFEPVMLEHPRLRIYVLKGRTTTLIWCRDSQDTWKRELEEGIAPEKLSGVKLDLAGVLSAAGAAASTYDPWTQERTQATLAGGKLVLPAFSRSIVVRLK